MRSEWMLPPKNTAEGRAARKKFLERLKQPSHKEAASFYQVLNGLSAEELLESIDRIPLNPDSVQKLESKKKSTENIAREFGMHKKDSDALFSRMLQLTAADGRKLKPKKRSRMLGTLEIGRAKNYFNEASKPNENGHNHQYLRRRNGISLHSLFRITLAAIESLNSSDFEDTRISFEKTGATVFGAQVCIVPRWVKTVTCGTNEESTNDCGALCMKHPETQEMIAAYRQITADFPKVQNSQS